MGNKEFVIVCKHYIREHHPYIFIIMETRIDPSFLCKMFYCLGFDGYLYSENQGYVGGIVMGWKSDLFQLILLQKHFQFLHVRVYSGDEASWNLTAAYASPKPKWKKELWQKFINAATKYDIGWVLGGDFNDIRDKYEKHGGVPLLDKKLLVS